MNYEEFKERLTEDLKQDLYERTGNEHFVNETNVNKLQNASYEALTIRPENSPIAVSLDVQSLFKEYEGGRGYEDICGKAVDIVSNGFANQPQFNIDDFTNYDVMKEKLAIQVVSTERNADMLENIPHKEIEDMSMVCRFIVDAGPAGTGSILVTNQMLENFGVTKEQLFDDAMKYAPDLRPSEIKGMVDMIAEIMGIDVSEVGNEFGASVEENIPMYVATTHDRTNGAGIIAYPGFLDMAAEKLGGDFYLLPSSVHEVILLKDNPDMDPKYLESMVRDVNNTHVAPEDRLSNKVYHYDSKDKVFELAEKFEARKQTKDQVKESVLKDLSDKKKEVSDIPKDKGIKMPKKGEQSL